MLTFQETQWIQKSLQGGEKILWQGKPNPGRMAKKNLALFFLSFFWIPFCLFWIWGASGFQFPPTAFGYFGVPFLLAGLYLFSSPLWGYFLAKKKAYVITDRNIIIFSNLKKKRFYSFPISEIEKIEVAGERKDKTGDLIFTFIQKQGNVKDQIRQYASKLSPKKLLKVNLDEYESLLIKLQQAKRIEKFFSLSHVRQVEEMLISKIKELKN